MMLMMDVIILMIIELHLQETEPLSGASHIVSWIDRYKSILLIDSLFNTLINSKINVF